MNKDGFLGFIAVAILIFLLVTSGIIYINLSKDGITIGPGTENNTDLKEDNSPNITITKNTIENISIIPEHKTEANNNS